MVTKKKKAVKKAGRKSNGDRALEILESIERQYAKAVELSGQAVELNRAHLQQNAIAQTWSRETARMYAEDCGYALITAEDGSVAQRVAFGKPPKQYGLSEKMVCTLAIGAFSGAQFPAWLAIADNDDMTVQPSTSEGEQVARDFVAKVGGGHVAQVNNIDDIVKHLLYRGTP